MKIFMQKNSKQKSQNLIIFFSGFASLPSHFDFLFGAKNPPNTQYFGVDFECDFGGDFDFLMCYDYSDFVACQTQIKEIIKSSKTYKNIYLIAWSMGVFIASALLSDFAKNNATDLDKIFAQKIAINGTNIGIDSALGIPHKIFAYTAKNIDSSAFRAALFESKDFDLADKNLRDFTQDFALPAHLRGELESLLDFHTKSLEFMQDFVFLWDKAIISHFDKVFPPRACEAFFAQNLHKNHTKIIRTNAPHFAFVGFKNWQEILQA